MTVQCCKCKRIRRHGRWAKARGRLSTPVSHTYCPSCAEQCRIELFSTMASRTQVAGAYLVLELVRNSAAHA